MMVCGQIHLDKSEIPPGIIWLSNHARAKWIRQYFNLPSRDSISNISLIGNEVVTCLIHINVPLASLRVEDSQMHNE